MASTREHPAFGKKDAPRHIVIRNQSKGVFQRIGNRSRTAKSIKKHKTLIKQAVLIQQLAYFSRYRLFVAKESHLHSLRTRIASSFTTNALFPIVQSIESHMPFFCTVIEINVITLLR